MAIGIGLTCLCGSRNCDCHEFYEPEEKDMPTVDEITKAKPKHVTDNISGEKLRREIARMLHSEVCPHNHTDGCGWMYEESYGGRGCEDTEKALWSCGQHKRYLDLAKRLEKKANWSLNDMKLIVDKYREYKETKKACDAMWLFAWKEMQGY